MEILENFLEFKNESSEYKNVVKSKITFKIVKSVLPAVLSNVIDTNSASIKSVSFDL